MVDANQLRAAYQRFGEVGRQVKARQERQEEIGRDIAALSERIKEIDGRRSGLLAKYATGGISQAEMDSAQEELAATRRKKAEAEEMLQALRNETLNFGSEYQQARVECGRARMLYCETFAAPAEEKIRTDSKLRRTMLDAFAATVASVSDSQVSGFGSNANWEGFITDIFPEPEKAELTEAIERFDQTHIRPVLGG